MVSDQKSAELFEKPPRALGPVSPLEAVLCVGRPHGIVQSFVCPDLVGVTLGVFEAGCSDAGCLRACLEAAAPIVIAVTSRLTNPAAPGRLAIFVFWP